jgi:hypothetical protein
MVSTLASSYSLETYWAEFDVDDGDLDVIYNLLLEREVPLPSTEMAKAVIEHRLERLEQEAEETKESEYPTYLPKEKYSQGDTLVFPLFNNSLGVVKAVRAGNNPDLGKFDVIDVELKDTGEQLEFAAQLEDHILNRPPEPVKMQEALDNAEAVMARFGDLIARRLEERLARNEDIVRIAGRWFPKSLLAEIHEGHLNLAEAILDVAQGGPLPTSELLEHLELPADLDPLLAEFSLDYAFQEDERFDEVGPAGQVLWFLRRLEPDKARITPRRLEYAPQRYDRSVLTDELVHLERKLDDELSDVAASDQPLEQATISILFPHWRSGTLPLSNKLQQFFPTAYEAPRIRFILVDGHSGDTFPGWVVRERRYVCGLADWYARYEIPAGGYVTIRHGEQPGQVVVRAQDRRRRNDWMRTVAIYDGDQIGFTMLKQPVGAAYDDLMVVGLVDAEALDEAWLKSEQRRLPFDRLVAYVFRELAKLNPQSAVHAQSLYSGLNVFRRVPPGPVFAELVTRPYYSHVGDSYWRFEDTAWRGS